MREGRWVFSGHHASLRHRASAGVAMIPFQTHSGAWERLAAKDKCLARLPGGYEQGSLAAVFSVDRVSPTPALVVFWLKNLARNRQLSFRS